MQLDSDIITVVVNNEPINISVGGNVIPTYTPPPNLPSILFGSGSPEGIVVGVPGSLYTDYFNVELYQKITGNSVNGWR